MRWIKGLGGLLLVVLVATGCIKVEGTIVVEDDGSGSVDMLTALDSEGVLAVLADFDFSEEDTGGTEDICNEFTQDMTTDTAGLPANAEVSEYRQDGFCGARVTYALEASTDHSQAIEGLFDGGGARLFKDTENWIFESNLDLSDLDSESEGMPPAMAEALFGGATIKFVVDLPGQAIDGQNNATTVGDNGRFEWDIDFANPPDRLFAQTAPGSSGGGLGVILVIVAILALLGAAAWWFLTQRKPSETGEAVFDVHGAQPVVTPPVSDTPAVSFDTPPVAQSAPDASGLVTPLGATNPSAKETVAMNAADVQAAAEQAAASPQPVFDESLNAWVIDDPVRGKLVHDTSTDTWKPA